MDPLERDATIHTSDTSPRPNDISCPTMEQSSTRHTLSVGQEPSAQSVTADHQRDISVKTLADTKQCMVTGCVLLPGNKLVLTDWNNDKVKLVSIQTEKVTSELKKKGWDVTAVSAEKVAVTVPNDKEILVLKVTDVFREDKRLDVGGACRGIAYCNDNLLVSFEDPAKIEFMSLDGRVKRTIDGGANFTLPYYLAPSPDCSTVYVSDFIGDVITRMKLNGDVGATYKELTSARGLGVGPSGRILVCTLKNIYLFEPDLSQYKVLISGRRHTWCLCYDSEARQLFVGTKSDAESVEIYNMK